MQKISLKNLKSIVLVSSGQPSVNPRLVKEADSLVEAGYEVTVIYQYWNAWATVLDEKLLPTKKWKAICVAGTPTSNKLTFYLSRILHKITAIISKRSFKFGLAEMSISRSSYFLYNEAKKHKAELYIGHNLGALAPVVKAAKYHHAKVGFDAEDFHRNEVSNDPNNNDVKLKTFLENKYFPQLDYLSTASPLITKTYQQIFQKLKTATLLNVFPRENITFSNAKSTKSLKLFWFSQTIGKERGLEEVIRAIAGLNDIELHLLGDLRNDDRQYFESFIKNKEINPSRIQFHLPIPSDQLISFASQFDVGLATETGIPYNRDICLTNKIFTYLQAGIAVIASDTAAQKWLLDEYPTIGTIYQKGDPQKLRICLDELQKNQNLLDGQKHAAAEIGKNTLNWEIESKQFLKIVDQLIG